MVFVEVREANSSLGFGVGIMRGMLFFHRNAVHVFLYVVKKEGGRCIGIVYIKYRRRGDNHFN